MAALRWSRQAWRGVSGVVRVDDRLVHELAVVHAGELGRAGEVVLDAVVRGIS